MGLLYTCPVCKKDLQKEDKSLKCLEGHCFDLSKKGYVNLLLSQHRNSSDPGDSKEMVLARRRFLETGGYHRLAEALGAFGAMAGSERNGTLSILDAGCGEGYYTLSMLRALSEGGIASELYGMDISKEAVHLASGRSKAVHWSIGSLFRLPFSNQSIDLITNIFAPASDSEFKRVLKKDGLLLTVIPGKDHLDGLKAVLYDKPYENDEAAPQLPSFSETQRIRVTDRIELTGREALSDLLVMTPYFWRTPREGIERLNRLPSLQVSLDFLIVVYRPL